MVNKWLNIALNELFPHRCVLCQQLADDNERDLCRFCEALQTTISHACQQCGSPLIQQSSKINEKSIICGTCLRDRPDFDRSHIPYIYEHGIRHLVNQFKFRNKIGHAPLLAQLFVSSLPAENSFPEALIPVPLHPRRLMRRGYNQSLLLAQAMGKLLGIPVEPYLAQRIKHLPPQSGLPKKQRVINLKQAFAMLNTHTYQHVAIVDDVMTTGTTVNALASVLKQSGVKQIDVWCIARTILD